MRDASLYMLVSVPAVEEAIVVGGGMRKQPTTTTTATATTSSFLSSSSSGSSSSSRSSSSSSRLRRLFYQCLLVRAAVCEEGSNDFITVSPSLSSPLSSSSSPSSTRDSDLINTSISKLSALSGDSHSYVIIDTYDDDNVNGSSSSSSSSRCDRIQQIDDKIPYQVRAVEDSGPIAPLIDSNQTISVSLYSIESGIMIIMMMMMNGRC